MDLVKNEKSAISQVPNEKALLELFVSKVAKADPDMIIAHGMCEGLFD